MGQGITVTVTAETAEALEMSEANIKVTLHRTRRIMGSYEKNRVFDFSKRVVEVRDTLQRFLTRLAAGDVQGVKEMLAADVVLITDGGGEINALAEPVYGCEKVLRLLTKLYEAKRDVTSASLQNVNGEFPIKWSGKYIKKEEAVHKFVFTNKKQLVHVNGLTFDFLFDMAKELDKRKSLLLLRGGEKGNEPIVMNRGGRPYNAFLEGRVRKDSYCLIMHLSNMELKKPKHIDADEA